MDGLIGADQYLGIWNYLILERVNVKTNWNEEKARSKTMYSHKKKKNPELIEAHNYS